MCEPTATGKRDPSGLPICSVRDVLTDADAKQSYCKRSWRDRSPIVSARATRPHEEVPPSQSRILTNAEARLLISMPEAAPVARLLRADSVHVRQHRGSKGSVTAQGEENSHKKTAYLRRTRTGCGCTFSSWDSTKKDLHVTDTALRLSWLKTRFFRRSTEISAGCRQLSKRLDQRLAPNACV
jgi:hypothetical protein